MTKANMLKYIQEVEKRIGDAPNHGHQGSDWWHRIPYTVAYNVKMYSPSKNIDDIRATMTPVQNKYYSDTDLYEITNDQLQIECDMLKDDIQSLPLVQSTQFAGKSGGWFEVTYTGLSTVDDSDTMGDIRIVYNEARELDRAESRVASIVHKAHADLMAYMNTDDYVRSITDNLASDADILATMQAEVDEYKKLA